MKHKLQVLIILTMTLFLGSKVMAQISERGIPASFAFDNSNALRATKSPFVTPIQFDVVKLRAEDKVSEENNMPLRTAMIIPVALDARNSGEWITLPNGQQIWTLTIDAPKAIATMLYYDEFFIPVGGKLFIYNEDHSQVIGAYTNLTNPTNGAFATEFVAGDKIILEYDAPLVVNNGESDFPVKLKPAMPNIKISGVGYGYNYLSIYRKYGDMLKIGESASCEVNINCSEGDNWQDEKKGIAKTVTPIGTGSYLCSGTLVNNTRQDMTPFFLTASHCFYNDSGVSLNSSQWNQIVYYFHYESPSCTTETPTATRTVVGAQMMVEIRLNGGSDGVLLKLNSSIPLDWNLYFNGWDRNNTPATSGVGIHHPAGDIKKISTFTQPAASSTANMTGGEVGAANAHWRVIFSQTENGWGQTEGGSSGSPLFNQDHLIVGTLTGGNSSCTNLSGTNIYGKLWYHWDHQNAATAAGVDLSKTMKDYLDPDNTGVETLGGTYTVNNEAVADFSASSTDIYVLESITYTDHSVGANRWTWTFEGGEPASWDGKTPPSVVYSTAGDFVTTLVANDGTGAQETKTMNIHVALKGTPEQPVANFAVPGIKFSEGFDSSPLSSNWIIDNKPTHTNPSSWTLGNLSGVNFNTIDPSSVNSIIAIWNAAHSDSWLTTANNYSIAEGSSIEFYALYSGDYLADATLNFLVSDDDGATWTQLWTAGSVNITRTMSWTRYSCDLSGYIGKNLKFAWQYVGDDGYYMGLDGIKLFGAIAQTTINVGDFITPIDLSTGTPVLWNWTFDGATPATATGQAPRVQYLTAGTYDITLTVTNTLGTDTKTIQNSVIVVDQMPIIAFSAVSQGYTMQENFGPYIPTNQSVNFTDKTGNYPLSWNWTLNGGNPANSTEQNPQGISYSASGTYDVTLAATNTAGTQTKTVPGFVKAGFNDPTRIWNLSYGETLTSYNSGEGAAFGSNVNSITMFSERFEAPLVVGYVSKVDIRCYRTGTSSGNMTVALFTDNSGVPGTQLATANVAISSIPQATAFSTGLAYTTVTFPSPVLVTGAFHIRISGLNSTGSGNSGRYVYIASAASRGDLAKNTAYIYYSNAWQAFPGLNTSLDVVPYFAYSANTTVDFDASPGYTLKSNNNLYIPTNAALNFTDLSTGFPPNAWNWTFDGGNPTTSTEQSPQVVYETSGTYNVALSVTNEAGGSGSLSRTGFVKAIYNEYNAIWNLLRGEAGSSVYTWGTGNYVSGTNTYGITDFAERFDAPITTGKISKVEILFYRSGTPSGTLTISIAKEEGGFPGTILASKNLVANTTNFPSNNATRLTTIDFSDSPVSVDGAYYIIVSGYTGTTGGVRSIAIASAANRGDGKHTFYYYDSVAKLWFDVSDDAGLYTSLNIAPYFAYSNEIEAAFVAENGYTRQTNYGQFIPTNASLNFFDQSIGRASSWNWTFTGANPAASNEANPQQITYNSDGEFAVKLLAKSLGGAESEAEVADYVKVGYDTPDKVWNMIEGEAGDQLLDTGGYGLFAGSNAAGDVAFAERFDKPLATGYISSVDIRFYNAVTSGSLTVTIQKEIGGEPGEILASKDLSVSDIANSSYTTITFDKPVYTDGAFYVVASGFDQWTNNIGIYSSDALSASAKNTAYVLDATDTWNPILESWGYSNAMSLNIVPTFTYSEPIFNVDGDLAVARKDIDATEATVTVTSNVTWTATTTADWVTIVNGFGNSDGTFTYTVADNTEPYPRVAKIIVAPLGLESLQQVIIVRQASTYPIGLTAEFEGEDVRVNWEALTRTSTPASDLSPVVKKNASIVKQISIEKLPFTPDLFGSRTAVRPLNFHSKSNRTFTLEDIMNPIEDVTNPTDIVVKKSTPEQKSSSHSTAKSSLRSTPDETVIRWESGNNVDAIGISNAAIQNYKLEIASLFTAADMTSMQLPSGISLIKKVEVYINNLPLDGITMKIRQGNITYQQKVSNAQLTPQSFNTITLDEAFALDNVSDTYIGYEFSVNGGMYVPGFDEGPAVAGKGDLLAEQGGPLFSLYDATGGGINGNWNIAAVVETGMLDHYVLYRDDTAISQTTEPTYLDTDNLSAGEHCYQVSVVFDDLESTLSNEGCIDIVALSALFTPSVDEQDFAAPGETQTITLNIDDPNDIIGSMGLNFYVSVPDWITYTISGNVISFTANANTTGAILSGVIQIWLGEAGSTFSLDNGYEIPVSQKSELSEGMLNYNLADVVYSGEAYQASVTLKSIYSGLGAITVLYNGSTYAPVEVGYYDVSINTAGGANFDGVSNFVLGYFTIYPAELTIRPDDIERPYGTANPDFTITFTGLASRDSQADLGDLIVTTTATESSLPGTYSIVASGAQNPNYEISYQEGTLTIDKLDQIIDYYQSTALMDLGDIFYIDASASSGLAVTYTSSNPNIADVRSNGMIKALSKGTVTITLSQAGNEIYFAADDVIIQLVVADFTGINQIASQSISVYPNPAAKSAPVYVSANIDEALLEDAIITIHDASGSLVKNLKVTGKLTKVNLPATTDTYIFTLKGKDGAIIKNMKVIVK